MERDDLVIFKGRLCQCSLSCDHAGHHYFRVRSVFFFAWAACQFLNTCLESDSSMGVLINYKSCASALMPWDRHKVRNCPVTQAPGLLHGTAEQQAAGSGSGGPAALQTPDSSWAGVVEKLPVPVPAGLWLCPLEPEMAPR